MKGNIDPIKEQSNEIMAKDVCCSHSVVSKFDANIKEMGRLEKGNKLVDYEIHESVNIESSKQYTVKIK